MATLQNFVDGRYVDAHGTETIDVVSPITEQVVAVSPVSDAADVDAAVQAAARAFPGWSRSTPSVRQAALLALADALDAHSDELVEAQRDMRRLARDIAASDVSPTNLRRRQARTRKQSTAPQQQDGAARP